jgi:hypothetical protein
VERMIGVRKEKLERECSNYFKIVETLKIKKKLLDEYSL